MNAGILCHYLASNQLKALSVRQPWCERILHEGKDIENRSWKTKHRGWTLLHAGKKTDTNTLISGKDGEGFPVGGYVGLIRIDDCVDEHESKWFLGEYGLKIGQAIPIELVPGPGALGFFVPKREFKNAIANAIVQAQEDGHVFLD